MPRTPARRPSSARAPKRRAPSRRPPTAAAPFVAPRDPDYERRIVRDEARDVVTRKGVVLFWGGWPSQWYPSAFTLGGVTYHCAEQYMMARKAELFGDEPRRRKILRAKYARAIKDLGRAVRPFDAEVWAAESRHAVYRATLAKVTQDPALLRKLLATGDRPIAEASPEDDLWGIGVGVKDPRAADPARWPGRNWLGEALMHVRATLRRARGLPRVTTATRDPFLPRARR